MIAPTSRFNRRGDSGGVPAEATPDGIYIPLVRVSIAEAILGEFRRTPFGMCPGQLAKVSIAEAILGEFRPKKWRI